MTLVRWTLQAVDDLGAIHAYIERDSPRYARLVVERIFDSTSRLELFPESGRVVPELAREDVREIVIGVYRVVYRLRSDVAIVLTVFRSSQLLPVDRIGQEGGAP